MTTKLPPTIITTLALTGGCFHGDPVGTGDASTGPMSSSSTDAMTTGDIESTTSILATTFDDTTEGADESSTDGSTGPAPNGPPQAHDDGPYPIEAGGVLEVDAASGLLLNDDDPDGDALMVVDADPVTTEGGVVVVNEDGSFSYLPPAGLPYGTDRFEYTVQDELGQTSTAEVRIAVQPTGGAVGLGDLGRKGVRFVGIDPEDECGVTVHEAGDIDGDGFADLLIGARFAQVGASEDAGEAYLVHGGPDLPEVVDLSNADVRFDGIFAGGEAGRFVSTMGDVDGDGFEDFIVTAWRASPAGINGAGESYLFYGGSGLPAVVGLDDADVRFQGIDPYDWSGIEVAAAGDVDSDGLADILVGAYWADPNGAALAGEAYLIHGQAGLAPIYDLANADVRFEGIAAYDRIGLRMRGIGDVDGDGYDDILLGATHRDHPGVSNAGTSYLFYGAPSHPAVIDVADADVIIEGLDAYDYSGGIGEAGDVNGDGYADLLIWAPQGDPGGQLNVGEAYLVYGGPALPSSLSVADADVRFEGIYEGDEPGWTIGVTGDVNGDGFSDILIGTQRADPDGNDDAGESYLFFGGPGLPAVLSLADADVRFPGATSDDRSGFSATIVSDVDGDGFADVFIGAPSAGPGGPTEPGGAYLAFGDDFSAEVTMLGTEADEDLRAIHGVGSDIIVAGRGDDTLVCDGGTDVLRGGQGDDSLVVVDDAFFRLDGGRGYDTLVLETGVAVDLTARVGRVVEGIEAVSLSSEGPSALTLSEVDVLRLSETSNTVTIDGDGDDVVGIVDGAWFGPVPDGGYETYSAIGSEAVVRVSPAVTVALP